MEEEESDNDDEKTLMEALLAAETAFNKFIDKAGYEGVYFCLDLKGYLIANDFRTAIKIIDINNYQALREAEKDEEDN